MLFHFFGTFFIATVGPSIVSLNLVLLGTDYSLFQCMSAVGYCLIPIVAAAITCVIVSLVLVRIIIVPFALYWSISVLKRSVNPKIPTVRRVIGLFPCGLIYTVLSWIVLMQYFVHCRSKLIACNQADRYGKSEYTRAIEAGFVKKIANAVTNSESTHRSPNSHS
jgi:hypothetical protein